MAEDEERDGNGKPNGAETVPSQHKAEVPHTRSHFAIAVLGLQYSLFFHDALLDQFKGQSSARQKGLSLPGLKFLVPILDWITTYTRGMLIAGFIAWWTIAKLATPEALGYARLAGVPPAKGLLVSLLLGTLLKQEIRPTDIPDDYFKLASTTTFFREVFQTVFGVFRLGFVTEVLSHEAALVGLFPVSHFSTEKEFISIMKSVFRHIGQVGHCLKKEIDPVSAHPFFLSGFLVAAVAKIGWIASLVALTEGVAIGRTFAALRDSFTDGNKETIAVSVRNLCDSAVTSCYMVSGSFSRSAVNFQAGMFTAMSNIIMSTATLSVLTPLFKYTPNTDILCVIIISEVLSLIELRAAWLICTIISKFDCFLACLGAFVGVFFVPVEIGLLVAVGISFVKILSNVTTQLYPNAALAPGVLPIRVNAAIDLSNSNSIHEKILHDLEGETGGARIQCRKQ